MNQFNFTDLMREVNAINDPNAKEFLLCEARAHYQQNVLSAGNAYLMQIESAITLVQKERELTVLTSIDENCQKPNKLKISVCLIFELLRLLGKGRNVNDLTALSKFASIITGFSKDHIQNTVQKGIIFSNKHHRIDIKYVNDTLEQMQMPFLIDISKKY